MTIEDLRKLKSEFASLLRAFKVWLQSTLKWVLKNWNSSVQEKNDLCSNHITCLYSKFCEIGNKFFIYYSSSSIVLSQFSPVKIIAEMFKNTKLQCNEIITYIKKFHSKYLVENYICYEDYEKNIFLWYFEKDNDTYSVTMKWLQGFESIFKSCRNIFVHSIKTLDNQKDLIDKFIYICPTYLLCLCKYLGIDDE